MLEDVKPGPLRRMYRRYNARLSTCLSFSTFQVPCQILDVSAGGAKLKIDPIYRRKIEREEWRLEIPWLLGQPVTTVRRFGNYIAVKFEIEPSRRVSLASSIESIVNCQRS